MNKLNPNIDNNSVGGAFFTFSTFLLSYFQLDEASKYGLWLISATVGITTIWYNIKKIKNLDK